MLKRRHAYAHTHRYRRLRRKALTLGMSLAVFLLGASTSARIVTSYHSEPIQPKPMVAPTQSSALKLRRNVSDQSVKVVSENPSTTLTTQQQDSTQNQLQVCTPTTYFTTSTDKDIKKLAPYEKAACGTPISSTSIYVSLPGSNNEADTLAETLAGKLSLYSQVNVRPYVIVQSQNASEQAGSMFDYFLATLKAKHADSQSMGTWVFFPFANRTEVQLDPPSFASDYGNYAGIFKEYFPNVALGLFLDASVDGDQYIAALPKGLVQSLGYQGLPAAGVEESARTLSVTSLWFAIGFPNDSSFTISQLTDLLHKGYSITALTQSDDDALRLNGTTYRTFVQELERQSIAVGVY